MRAPTPAPAAWLLAAAAGLLVFPPAALASGLCKITSDDCLQAEFLSALDCDKKNPAYNNATLPAAGYFLCWSQGPFVGSPTAKPISAWLTINDDGVVTDRCLAPGSGVEYYKLPEYAKCQHF